jgi:hypothetical protein
VRKIIGFVVAEMVYTERHDDLRVLVPIPSGMSSERDASAGNE